MNFFKSIEIYPFGHSNTKSLWGISMVIAPYLLLLYFSYYALRYGLRLNSPSL